MPKRILGEKYVTNSEAIALLEEGNVESFSQFQRRALEYLRRNSKGDQQTDAKMLKSLHQLGDITSEEAIQIINLKPKSREELRTIFYHRRTILESEFLDKILKILKE